jgi:DNA-binding MarR family transcriptional regulator
MQLLQGATKALRQAQDGAPISDDGCARELLDTLPMGIRVIRRHMRRHRSGLTVPQFRTLCFLTDTPGSSLSAVADFVGLSLPAMSRLVDGLVDKGLMQRRPCSDDRRQVRLSITPPGEAAITEARQLAQARLAEAVAPLTQVQRAALIETMAVLRDIFARDLAGDDDGQPCGATNQ